MFFNNFLPTSIGGDGYRVWKTINMGCPRAISLLAVLAERVSGIIVLLGLGLVGAWISWFAGDHGVTKYFAISGLAAIAFVVLLLMIFWRVDYIKKYNFEKYIPDKVKSVFGPVQHYLKQPVASFTVLVLLSLVFHVLSIAWKYILIRAVGGSIEIWDFTLVTALIALVTIVPLSINGFGTVDVSFIWLVGQFGVPFEAGLAYMILFRVLLIPVSLLGAIFFLKMDRTDASRAGY